MVRRKIPAMPTPPRSYSAAAAEKLRLALLALAASAAVVASAQDVPDDDPADTDVLGEIPEDIEEGGVYVCNPCEKKSCASDDCMCDGPCEEGKPCTDCDDEDPGDDPGIDEEPDDTTNDNGTTNFAFQMDDELVVNGEGTLQLFDINGRCLLSTQAVGEQSTISLPRVAAGIYVLRLTNHNQTKVQKMVIK